MIKKLFVTILLTYATTLVAQTACSTIDLGPMAALNGFVPSPNDAWHQDISTAAVDGLSSWLLTGAIDLGGSHLNANFSSVAGGNHGIPYTVVDSQTTPGISLPITLYPNESDITLVPIPATLPIEESSAQCPLTGNSRRAIILDRNQCVLYEIYQADNCATGNWTGSNIALWDLTATEKRPYGFTSADAAGLSVFEGLVRYDEIVAGVINHAIRFTANNTQMNEAHGLFVAPATHAAGNTKNTDNDMGMRLRLKANFDISGFSTTNQIILTALKTYGMILADNGPNLAIEGTPDARWDDNDLAALKSVLSSNMEVLKRGTLYDASTAPKGVAPVITSFTADTTSIQSGDTVTLTPTVTGAAYSYIDNAGFTRGPITVSPTATTTYTLTSRNEFGSASASVTVTVGGSQTTPTLTFAAIPATTFGAGAFAVSATSQSTGAITYSIASGPATISGSIVSVTGTGTVVVNASQAAAGPYNAATATTSFTVAAADPALAFVTIPNQSNPTAVLTVSTTTSSTGSIVYSVTSGPATIAGNQVTLTGAGIVTLQANQAAAGNYLAATATTSFTVAATNPGLAFAAIPNQSNPTATLTVSATSASTGVIVYSILSGPATIAGNQVTLLGPGTVSLQADQAAAGNYLAATATTSFTVSATNPGLAFVAIPNQSNPTATLTVSATSASTGAIVYSVLSGPAAISGNTLTLTGAGTVNLQANQAAAGNYLAATATTSFTVSAANPGLAFVTIANQTNPTATITVSATSASTGAIVYSVLSGPATISGNQVTLSGPGTVSLQASQAAAGNYLSATATTSFTVAATNPGLAFVAIPNQVYTTAALTLSTTSSSTGSVTYSVVSGPATIAGNKLSLTGIGTVSLQASQAAAGNYLAATATTSFTVAATNPGLAFVTIPNQAYATAALTLSTTTSSTGTVTYSVVSGPATIVGNKLTLTGIGTVSLKATQAAAGNYLAATATTSFTVSAANPGLAFVSIANQSYPATALTVSATSSSTGSIVYSVLSGPATISGSKLTLTGAGTVSLKASQAAAGNYLAATATTSFTVSATQTTPKLTFTAIPLQILGIGPIVVTASSASTGAITYSVVSGPATILGNLATLLGVGTVTIQASQAAAGIYGPATATTSFSVQAAGTVVGGKVTIPAPPTGRFYVHVSQTGNAYLMNAGATTNKNAGIFVANASACESSPTTCAWTAIHTGEPASGGSYDNLSEMVDVDSTHELGIFGFSGQSRGCSNCSIQILDTTAKTYKKITLPGQPAGESPVCMAHDSNGIFYTMLNYHAGIWKSTDRTANTWTEVTSDYTTLPGLTGSGGNVYNCKVLGSRIYFGGEGGVISCNLAFSSCSQDYLPFGTGQRNFTGLLADVDEGSTTAPTMMLMCCKQDTTVTNYVPFSRYSGGTWTQLTTSSGLPQYGQGLYFETFNVAAGTGTARRYYVMFFNSKTANAVYKSTDSTGKTFALFTPTQWPKLTTSLEPEQLTPDPRNGAVWSAFMGSGTGLYITP